SRRALRQAQRGVVYYAAIGEYEAALDDLDKAIAAQPRDVDGFIYRLAAFAVAVRAKDPHEQARRQQDLIDDHEEGNLWHNRVTRLLTGEQNYDTLVEATLRPLERCAL